MTPKLKTGRHTSESLMLDQSYPAGEKDELCPRYWGRLFTQDGP